MSTFEQVEIMEQGHQLVGLFMLKAIPTPVLDEGKLRIDALNDGCRGRLG